MRKLFAGLLFAAAALPASAQDARFDWFEYKGSNPGQSAARAGEYRNPILGGFYPDPSVTRVGDDFYLVNSTFSYFPGIPVFHSRDLVNWTQIGNAIDRPDQLDFKRLGMSRGVFAPSIQWHAGLFYILNTCVDCGGNFVITAKDPAGPWSTPVWLPSLEGGIDPSLFFDDDGRTWLVYNNEPEGGGKYQGHRAIWVQELNLRTLEAAGPRTMILNGGVDLSKKPIWIEGPHILRKDGWYYLICAEGGTAEGHSQVVLRAKSVTGPYQAFPGNPILTQRDLPRGRAFPITSAGHAQLVDTPDGKWWATFLATRPYADDFYNTGRETFLMPVTWADGWPRITVPKQAIPYSHKRPALRAGEKPPVPTSGSFTVRDDFALSELPPYWMMMRNPRSRWYRFDDGKLVLIARGDGLGDYTNPSFLARRQQHTNATASTVVRFDPEHDGDRAGLVALQNDDYWAFAGVGMEGGHRVVTLEARAGGKQPAAGVPVKTLPLDIKPGTPVYLQVTATGAHYSFAYALRPGQWQPLGEIDGTALSTKTAGGFIGAVFGVYAKRGS